MNDEMTYSAYSTLHDEISLLDNFLKVHEPVKPIMRLEMDDICSCFDNVAYCGKCGALIGRLKQNYCSNCGREKKWDA